MRRPTRKLVSLIGAAALVAGGLLVLTPTSGGALTQIVVANNADSGAGSLRQAFVDASSGTAQNDDVEIIIPTSVGDITLTTALALGYNGGNGGGHSLTLKGGGNTITQTGVGAGVINLTGGTTFSMDNLILTGGGNLSDGGAIRSPGGTDVVITNSTLTDNMTSGSGGAIHMFGDLTLTNSTISDNGALGAAGGVFAAGGVVMTGSTISGNNASVGGGLHFDTSATITNSTITGNTATGDAGGVLADDNLVLRYATISGNTSATGGANIHFRSDGVDVSLTSFGSVVANPTGGINCFDQTFTSSEGYNFEDANSCGFGLGPGDQTNAGNPLLGALASNGGPTKTMAPEASSGLVNKIPASSPCAGVNITVDQRGLPRPVTAGQLCDIGAYEIQVAALQSDDLNFTG